jgi:hypothetical protein
MSPTTAAAGKGHSSLDVIEMHTTYHEGALALIPEQKALWNIW